MKEPQPCPACGRDMPLTGWQVLWRILLTIIFARVFWGVIVWLW